VQGWVLASMASDLDSRPPDEWWSLRHFLLSLPWVVFPFRVVFPSGLVVVLLLYSVGFSTVSIGTPSMMVMPVHSFIGCFCARDCLVAFPCTSLVSILPLVRCLVHGVVPCSLVKLAPLFHVFCALPFAIVAVGQFNRTLRSIVGLSRRACAVVSYAC
jgi:hypothetical protein